MVHNIINFFYGWWAGWVASRWILWVIKQKQITGIQLRFMVLRFAVLKTACGYNKGHFKMQAAFIESRHWLILKNLHSQLSLRRDSNGVISQHFMQEILYLCDFTACSERKARSVIIKLPSEQGCEKTLLHCSFRSDTQVLTITAASSVSALKRELQVLQQSLQNQHFQSHFPSIKMGPFKQRKKMGLHHIHLRTLAASPCSTPIICWSMIWGCKERLQPFLVLKIDDSKCAFHFCMWAFYFWLSHLPVTGAYNEKLWKILPKAALYMKLQFHTYKCLFSQSWNSKFCGCWTKSSKILCASAKYESYWGNLIAEGNCINSYLFFILVWLHCIAFFLSKNDRLHHPYHTEIKTWIQLADILVRCTGTLLRLDKFWWVCSVHKCHAKSLTFGSTYLLS